MNITYPAGDSGMILVFDGLISENVCKQFTDEVSSIWNDVSFQGKTLGGVDIKIKNSFDMAFSEMGFTERNMTYPVVFKNMESIFLNGFIQAIAAYQNKYRALHSWIEVEDTGFQVQCYNKCMGWYREHVDSFPGTEAQNRVLSGIIYLNDVEQGGQTRFPLHDVEVEARAGRIVLFPSNFTHPHEGKTPLSNDKWILNTFFVLNEQPNQMNSNEHHEHDGHEHDHLGNHLPKMQLVPQEEK